MTTGLASLSAYQQFILYRAVPSTTRPGKTDKLPTDYRTGQMCDAHDPSLWTDAVTAYTMASKLGASHGVGFVLTANDPFFCLDIDGCLMPDGKTWSPFAHHMVNRFPDAAVEVSFSGTGLHIWGTYTGAAPAHGCRNGEHGAELYTELRFIALGHPGATGDAGTDCTDALASVIFEFFPATISSQTVPSEWTDYGTDPATDTELITKILAGKKSMAATFGSRASFADLWNANADALAKAYPEASGMRPYDCSSSDMALAVHLAWWTGNDCERIKRLMLQSGLVREKYDRPDYLTRTILKACAMQETSQFESRLVDSNAQSEGVDQEWPKPQPLAVKVAPKPYPIDALPGSIRAAVEEVAGFVKAPLPMLASSALGALSLAIQAHADAKRAEKLHGPVGLFLLTIADSGERKSTCDGFFTTAIHDYEEAQAEAAKPILKNHKADIESWEAKRGGIKDKIRQLAKENKPTAGKESDLRDLEHDKPEPPRIPRLLFTDATPEALAYGLANQWPSGGVVSAEAGIVFGSHGMGKDSAMRNLGLLNQLWDGNSLTIDRRTSESFTVRGARLTVALQVQEPTLREFFTRSGALARGTGFLARFLVAWPESTQGFRPFTEAPENWPHLATFNRRIAAILDQPVPIDEDGALTPAMLPLTPDAKAAWIEYHDAIESELASGGELYDVRDVASKSADNAVRLAALFQVFEGGGAIGLDCFEWASRIAAWHLHEARRFFGELALPTELAYAARLDSWLVEYCKRERTRLVGKNYARQHGPLRDGASLDAAIRELADLDRVRLVKDGKKLTIKVNPALVEVTA